MRRRPAAGACAAVRAAATPVASCRSSRCQSLRGHAGGQLHVLALPIASRPRLWLVAGARAAVRGAAPRQRPTAGARASDRARPRRRPAAGASRCRSRHGPDGGQLQELALPIAPPPYRWLAAWIRSGCAVAAASFQELRAAIALRPRRAASCMDPLRMWRRGGQLPGAPRSNAQRPRRWPAAWIRSGCAVGQLQVLRTGIAPRHGRSSRSRPRPRRWPAASIRSGCAGAAASCQKLCAAIAPRPRRRPAVGARAPDAVASRRRPAAETCALPLRRALSAERLQELVLPIGPQPCRRTATRCSALRPRRRPASGARISRRIEAAPVASYRSSLSIAARPQPVAS
ncbi:hypothetical protein B8V81_5056 [Paenibacillus pasadenensis]|uniref:Uncharacterized protein n=1 Tax=Paenibacillus pasadenensis TaxID=217090 RepID=A0A2N5MZK6_9BACL|nr:hypothetical protein B8V81_5056 [Paenibacillus pasadenensis]